MASFRIPQRKTRDNRDFRLFVPDIGREERE